MIYIENVPAEELISIKNCGRPLCALKVITLKFSTSLQKFDWQALIIVYIYIQKMSHIKAVKFAA